MLAPLRIILFALVALAWPALAFADPCEGALPQRAGVQFSGTVRPCRRVEFGRIEVGQTRFNPGAGIAGRAYAQAIPVANMAGAKAALERIAMGRTAQCVACMRR